MQQFMRFFIASVFMILFSLTSVLQAQTTIDLNGKKQIRPKTIQDYDRSSAIYNTKDSTVYKKCLSRAFNALAIDSLNEAEKAFREALKISPLQPANALVHYQLGLIYESRKQLKEALEEQTRALQKEPELMDARLQRASLYLQTNQVDRGIADYSHVLKQEPTNKEALFFRAYLYSLKPDYNLSRTDYESLLRLQPTDGNTLLGLAILDQKCGRPKEALEVLDRLITYHPSVGEYFAARAGVHTDLQQIDLAIIDWNEGIRLEPKKADYLVGRAMLYLVMKNKVNARRDLDKAVTLGVSRGQLQDLYNQTK